MRRLRGILRGVTITVLSLGALLSLTFMLVGFVQAMRKQPSGVRVLVSDSALPMRYMYVSTIRWHVWTSRRYSLYIWPRDGRLTFTQLSESCLLCGKSHPGHTTSCPIGQGATVDYTYAPRPGWTRVRLLGVDWWSGVLLGVPFEQLTVSLWLLLLVSAPYPAIAFIRGPFRRHRRRKRGACVTCGYDLTGNVSGRCPECGSPANQNAPRTAP